MFLNFGIIMYKPEFVRNNDQVNGNCPTHVKTHKLVQVCKQIVTRLFTSCQQVVLALFQFVVTSLEQVVDNL